MKNLKSQISNLKWPLFALAIAHCLLALPAQADDGALNLLVDDGILWGAPATNLNAKSPWANGPFPTNMLPGALPALSSSNFSALNLNTNNASQLNSGTIPTGQLPVNLIPLASNNAGNLTNLLMVPAGNVEIWGNNLANLANGYCFWPMWPNNNNAQNAATYAESTAPACTYTELTATYGPNAVVGAGTNIIAALLTNGVFAAGITNTGPLNGTSVYSVTLPINVPVTNGTLVCFKIWNTSSGIIGGAFYNVSLYTGR